MNSVSCRGAGACWANYIMSSVSCCVVKVAFIREEGLGLAGQST